MILDSNYSDGVHINSKYSPSFLVLYVKSLIFILACISCLLPISVTKLLVFMNSSKTQFMQIQNWTVCQVPIFLNIAEDQTFVFNFFCNLVRLQCIVFRIIVMKSVWKKHISYDISSIIKKNVMILMVMYYCEYYYLYIFVNFERLYSPCLNFRLWNKCNETQVMTF